MNNTDKGNIVTYSNRNCVFYTPSAVYGDYDNKYLFKTKWKENTQYTISFDILKTGANNRTVDIVYTDETYSQISNLTAVDTWEHKTITSTVGKTIKYIKPSYTAGNTYIDINSFMVEEGTTASQYITNQTQTKTFPLGTEKLYLGDYLADDGIHHVRAQKIYDGSSDEDWSRTGNAGSGATIRYTISNPGMKLVRAQVVSNMFYQWGGNQTDNFIMTHANSNIFWIGSTQIDSLADLTEFRQWLSENNLIVEYELEEEEIVPYTQEQQIAYNEIKSMLSYEGQTNIYSTNTTSPIFDVEAYQNTKLLLENIENRLTLVEG